MVNLLLISGRRDFSEHQVRKKEFLSKFIIVSGNYVNDIIFIISTEVT